MCNINKKRFLLPIVLTFVFLAVNIFSPEIISITCRNNSYGIVYAIGGRGSSASSRGFKSGSFKSSRSSSTWKSSTGGFKSGSFKSSKSYNSTQKSSKSFSSGSKRTYIPIPIPIPTGSHRYYGPSYGHFSANYFGVGYIIAKIIGGIVKFILFIIIVIFILNIIKRIRRY